MNQYEEEELPPEVLQQIDAVTKSVLEMSDRQIHECYRLMFPEEDPREKVHGIAENICQEFSARGLPCPPHVQEVLASTAPSVPHGSVLPFTPVKKRDRKKTFSTFILGYVAVILMLGLVTVFVYTRPEPTVNHTPHILSKVHCPSRGACKDQPGHSGETQDRQSPQVVPIRISIPRFRAGKKDVPRDIPLASPSAPPASQKMDQAGAKALANFLKNLNPQQGQPQLESSTARQHCRLAESMADVVCFGYISGPSDSERTALQAKGSSNWTESNGVHLDVGFTFTRVQYVKSKISPAESNHNQFFDLLGGTALSSSEDLKLAHVTTEEIFPLLTLQAPANCYTTSSDCKHAGYLAHEFSVRKKVFLFEISDSAQKDLPSGNVVPVSTNDGIKMFWGSLQAYTPSSDLRPVIFSTPSPTTAFRVPGGYDPNATKFSLRVVF